MTLSREHLQKRVKNCKNGVIANWSTKMNATVSTMNPMLSPTIVAFGAKNNDTVIPTQKRIAIANEAQRSPLITTKTAPQNAPPR